MNVVILYRPHSEHASAVESFVREFKLRNGTAEIELVDVDSPQGSDRATLYGVVQYPAILALRNDGSLQHIWEGGELPLLDEIAYYTIN